MNCIDLNEKAHKLISSLALFRKSDKISSIELRRQAHGY
jgi:hypothetical protein